MVSGNDNRLEVRKEFSFLFTSGIPNIGVVAARGTGKTVAAVQSTVYRLLNGRCNSSAVFFSATLSQAKGTVEGPMRSIMSQYPKGFCNYNASEHKYKFHVGRNDVRELILLSYENQETKRGYHPDTIVLDECGSIPYSMLGLVIEPMLAPAMSEGCGRLLAIGTAKGKNKFYELIERGRSVEFPDWESYVIRASDCNLFDSNYLTRARFSLSPSEYAQEFECDFEASVLVGSIYAPLINECQLRDKKFISDDNVYDPSLPVHTAWDLGHSNNTSIWFFQVKHGNPIFIDFFEDSGRDITYYVNEVLGRGYVLGKAFLPHDADAKNIRSPITISEMLSKMHLPNVVLSPSSIQLGIEQTKLIIKSSKFNEENCKLGMSHLKAYRYKIDYKSNFITGTPLHDEHSDAADALRYAAMSKEIWQRGHGGESLKVFYREDYNMWQ